MKNKLLNNTDKKTSLQGINSTVINIDNSEVLDIFGINNENIEFFENNLPLKIFQKGNQLIIHGNKIFYTKIYKVQKLKKLYRLKRKLLQKSLIDLRYIYEL